MKKTIAFFFILIIFGCADISRPSDPTMQDIKPAFALVGISDDETYGYTEENPIKLGHKDINWYLAALRGLNGESISYSFLGVHPVPRSPNSFRDAFLLIMVKVSYDGLSKPIVLYFDHESGEMKAKAPVGFTHE